LLNAAPTLLNNVHFLAQWISLRAAFCVDSGVASKKQLTNRKLRKADGEKSQ